MIELPCPQRLAAAPEMAVLAALDAAAEAASRALEAVFPGLEQHEDMTRPMRAAEDILHLASELQSAIARYELDLDQTIPLPLRWNSARAPF